jgi:WS/DGAT/MGAT family acyltransferase
MLDAEFLHMEDDLCHMHIAGLSVFEGPVPEFADLIDLIDAKLHLIPRYRQRIHTVPFALGRPHWVDDPEFDLERHVFRTALPTPGGAAELNTLMGRLTSQPLSRDRPLWEVWLVEGLENDRWGLISKVHHCMVDGVAGVGLLTILLDLEPNPEPIAPPVWEPEPFPGPLTQVLQSWTGLMQDSTELLRSVNRHLDEPGSLTTAARELALGSWQFIRRGRPSAPLSITGDIGPSRVWRHERGRLADVTRIRRAFGGTVNDVVLTVVTAGYRAMLEARGEDLDSAVLTTMVPVSVRRDATDAIDNRVSTLLFELPVSIADPVERLAAVRSAMDELKASHMARAGEVITSLGNLLPPMVVGPATRLLLRAERAMPQPLINTVVTNVPGPQFPLFCLGRRMLEAHPFIPLSQGVRISTGILSYDGALSFGVTGDADRAADVAHITDAIGAELRRLVAAAERQHTMRSHS